MARKIGQIIAVRDQTWMVRIPLGRDPETKKRSYYNRTIHGSLRQAQRFLNRKRMNSAPIVKLMAERFG